METKLENDVRIKTAKVRLQERARKNQEEGAEERAKRRKLAEIEDRVRQSWPKCSSSTGRSI